MRKKRVFYGWWIVLATSIIHFCGAGILFYSFTAFFNPLVQEFKWSYAATSLATSFRSLESGIAAPLVGFLTDRFGPRRLILAGTVWACLGCIFLSHINSLWAFYAAFFFLSIGTSMMFPLPGWTAVTNWFSRKRGTAMGISVAAIGASGVLIPFVSWLIAHYGWRVAFVIAGFSVLIIGAPLSLVVRHRPEQYSYLPDGEEEVANKSKGAVNQRQFQYNVKGSDIHVGQATRTWPFWIVTLAVTVSATSVHAVTVHVMPCLVSSQIPWEVASSIAALLVVSSVAGRMGYGWLGDRIDKKYLLASALLLQALGLIIFAYTRSTADAVTFLVLFGPGYGGVITLRLSIQADYFGRKAFGSIQGVMQGIAMVGTILGPVFAGWVYDARGSYQLAWLGLAILILPSIPLSLTLKRAKEQVPS